MNKKKQALRQGHASLPCRGLLATALALAALPAQAALIFWDGAADGDWNNTGNWIGGVLPTGADTAYVNDSSVNAAVVGVGINAVAQTTIVGNSTQGDLTISGGGSLSGSFGVVGLSGGDGAVTVTGAGSVWTATTNMTVGQSASGSLSVFSGGVVSSGGGQLGSNAGSVGTVTVDGAGSQWTMTNTITVGNHGQAMLTVSGAGAVSGNNAYLASSSDGDGTVSVTGTGSTLSVAHVLWVGESGVGALNVLAGGVASNDIGVIGRNSGSVGTASIDGAGSNWMLTGSLDVGQSGQGGLEVTNGGVVGAVDGVIGANAGGTGTALVDGAGSQWNLTGSLDVGLDGQGGLTISNGGAVAGNLGYIGRNAGIGTVLVTGAGSTWGMTNDLLVGDAGQGDMTIAAGASVINGGTVSVGNGAAGFGSVSITGAGSSWQISSNISIGSHGTGEVTVANGGALTSASGIVVAAFAGSNGALNIGATAAGAATAPGSVGATNIVLGLGAGTINFNHTGSAYTFATPIQSINAAPGINQIAGTTILTGDNSGFLGTTTISGGKLVVDNALGGSVVMAGGALGGSGTLGGLTVNAGATLAPGNSIGTLNVAGNAAINAGSTYAVEVDDLGNSDLLHATGTVTIDPAATVHVTPVNGTDDGSTYAANTLYTIVTGDTGVAGVFGSVTDTFAFLDASLSYDANHAYLTLTQVVHFTAIASTPNQLAAAGASEALGTGNAIHDALLVLGTSQALAAFDAVSGEIYATARGILIEDSRFARAAALERGRVGGAESSYWLRGVHARANNDGDGNAADFERAVSGFLLGGDTGVGGDTRVGLLFGYQRASFDVDARAASGSAETWQLGAYGNARMGGLDVRFGAVYGKHDLDVDRAVAMTGFADSLSASPKATTAQAFCELGHVVEAGRARLEPFANLAHVHARMDGFTEQGGAAALASTASSSDTTFATLGLRAGADTHLGATQARLRGTLGWRHAVGDVTPASRFNFAGGNAFTISGVPLARDSATLEAGAVFTLARNATLDLAYTGQIGSGVSDHGAAVSLQVKF